MNAEHILGVKAQELCWNFVISDAVLYKPKVGFICMEASDAKTLRVGEWEISAKVASGG
jgi:hypothetical protein